MGVQGHVLSECLGVVAHGWNADMMSLVCEGWCLGTLLGPEGTSTLGLVRVSL